MEPKVSIICITFNHAEFLADALESFVSQETDFDYEIIVHDDCSTDGTTDILRRYAEKYPDKIVPLYEEQNCYSRGVKINKPMMTGHARGKYIALCEGDDYWCDNKKLQKQFDFMEKETGCSLLMHNGYSHDYISGEKVKMDPYPGSGKISDREVIIEGKVMPPTASMFFRRSDILEMPEFFWEGPVGDRTRRMYLINKGYVYYSDEAMCVYRTNVPGSFAQRMKKSPEQRKRLLDRMLKFFSCYDEYTGGKYKDEVDFIVSREWFQYYMRCDDRKNARKTRYYKETFTAKEKLKIIVGGLIPESLRVKLKKTGAGNR